MSDELKEFFREHGIVLNPQSHLHEKLVVEYGVEKVSDISLLTEQELRQAGLNKIQSRTLLRDSKPTTLQPAAPGTTLQSAVPGLTESLKLDYESSRPFSPLPKTARFKINYVLCIEMFVVNQEEHSLALEPEQDTMDFLIKQICSIHKLPDVLTLELYHKNGTPLNINEYTMSFTLDKWKIKNDDSFYVLPRRREQPSWVLPEPLNDVGIDPTEGQNTLRILSEVFGRFSIQVNFPNLTVKMILQKASRVINVPSEYLKIYNRLENLVAMKDEDLSQIVDGQELILRLGEVYSNRIEFGKSSYIPVTEQTEKGLAKFYSILKYLTIGSDVNRSSIVAAVFKLTGCVPLVAALHTFLIYHSFSHLSQIAILFEGFYHLSKAILKYFCNVNIENTFEFLDYIFGLIIKLSKATSSNDHLSYKVIRLRCPITAHNIIEPVMIFKNESSYEKDAAIAKIERNEALPECSVSVGKGNLIPDDQMQHLLIAFSFSKIVDIQVCETVSEGKMRISPLISPCTWREFKESLIYLKIVSPNSSFSKRVTYTKEGYLTVFIEISKSSDLGRIFYDPLTGKNNTYTEEQLEEFAKSKKLEEVSHNVVDFLNPKIKALLEDTELTQSVSPTSAKGITREPQEAIVVLLDTSSSMNSQIFESNDAGSRTDIYKRITAAKDFFFALANRTQAYELHHVISVISFNRQTEELMPFSESLEQFKTVVGKADQKISRGTALYDALKKGATALNSFSSQYPLCHKRILCLTDGEDYRSKMSPFSIACVLKTDNIIVDTVLLTGPSGNGVLKAISHATGGLCFLPKSRTEGMRIFEMEILLSVRQRSKINKPNLRNQVDFRRLQEGNPYDSTDPFSFRSSFFMGLDETITCSAKRMVWLASFISDGLTSSSSQQPHVKTIMRELMRYEKDPHEDMAVFPNETNVCHWKILVRGPKATPYDGGIFLLFAKFPKDYPYKPPEMRFVTPIYHCNINSVGRICHPILGRNYVPSLSVKEIFDQVYGLLMAPEPDDPLDSVLADEFHTNKDEYMRKAHELTQQKAIQISWEEYKTALSEETAEVTDDLKCPLTGKLFMDPVMTPFEHTYERDALLQYMDTNENMDPIAKQSFDRAELRSCSVIKSLAENFRKAKLI